MTLQGNWNKETMILKTLHETDPAEAEWVMWLDIDTIIPDMAVVPRFDEYDGADLVVWGDREKLMEGNLNAGAFQLLCAFNTDMRECTPRTEVAERTHSLQVC